MTVMNGLGTTFATPNDRLLPVDDGLTFLAQSKIPQIAGMPQ